MPRDTRSSGCSLDLAVSRFSGRRAPVRPNADPITKEGYSHEVISVGFWPGDGEVIKDAAFYAYAYPEPPGYGDRAVRPEEARSDRAAREFILPYEAVRTADDPDEALLQFVQTTYEAAADLAQWDRAALDRPRSEWP